MTDGLPAPRVLFVGAVGEGRRCLDAMIARHERFAGIVTLNDSLAATTSGAVPFDDVAREQGIPLLKVANLNSPDNIGKVRELAPDLILVIGWTRLLGKELLSIPRLGCVGFHASLLPAYRGRAPVNWAIINGETETGNTMIFLDEGVDTGDIIARRRIPISREDTCATLYEKVSDSAIEMLAENLLPLKQGRAPRRAQDHASATVMQKRRPEDGVIDWNRTSAHLHDWVRALTHPYPGAFTGLDDRRLFIWQAGDAGGQTAGAGPGMVLEVVGKRAMVATGSGKLAVLRAQWEGAPEIPGSSLAELIGRRLGQTPGRTA